jgi:hypothetical protein
MASLVGLYNNSFIEVINNRNNNSSGTALAERQRNPLGNNNADF